jgi:hypothetical protein
MRLPRRWTTVYASTGMYGKLAALQREIGQRIARGALRASSLGLEHHPRDHAGICIPTSENPPSETVWKIGIAPSLGLHQWAKGSREALFCSPVPSHIHYRESLQLFSKQFLRDCPKRVGEARSIALQTVRGTLCAQKSGQIHAQSVARIPFRTVSENEFSEGRTWVRMMALWLWWKGLHDPLKASGRKGESHALYDHVPHSHG